LNKSQKKKLTSPLGSGFESFFFIYGLFPLLTKLPADRRYAAKHRTLEVLCEVLQGRPLLSIMPAKAGKRTAYTLVKFTSALIRPVSGSVAVSGWRRIRK
jgi:hypothetical protein